MDLEFKSFQLDNLTEIGHWLDQYMPNPPIGEEQRWSIGSASDGERFGIKFLSDNDAIMFSLKWLG